MYKNVQLLIDKKVYPQPEFENTWDGRFVQYQLCANELDGVEATQVDILRVASDTPYHSPPLTLIHPSQHTS